MVSPLVYYQLALLTHVQGVRLNHAILLQRRAQLW
jgi:hypothetical protein